MATSGGGAPGGGGPGCPGGGSGGANCGGGGCGGIPCGGIGWAVANCAASRINAAAPAAILANFIADLLSFKSTSSAE
jgi:hypothetical protein